MACAARQPHPRSRCRIKRVHPCRGLKKRRDKGCLLVSADLDELLLLCDRIIVMYDGRVAAEFAGREADRDSVGRAMLGLGQGQPSGQDEEVKAR